MKQSLPSLDLAYEVSKGHYEMVAKWIDSIDSKIVAVFSVASLFIGILLTFKGVTPMWDWVFIIFCLAAASFVATAYFCWNGFRTRRFIMGNNPRKLLEQYASREPDYTKEYLLKYWGENFEHNLSILQQKAFALRWAITCAGIEVILLLVWLVTT